MRGIFKWFILLIGTVSFMGFSATADLPQNSFAAFTDHDVGIQAVLVEKNFTVSNYTSTSTLKSEYIVEGKYLHLTQEFNLLDLKLNLVQDKLIEKRSQFMFRSPRDSLRC